MCLISFIIHGLFQLSFPPPKTFLLTLTLSGLVPGLSNVTQIRIHHGFECLDRCDEGFDAALCCSWRPTKRALPLTA
jgi:hypothetical protein